MVSVWDSPVPVASRPVHETIRMTPAMALGVTDHIWDIGDLIDAALSPEAPEPNGRRVGRFTVIDGGLVN